MANKVKAVPNLPRQARAGTRVQVDGLNGVLKKLERLASWSEKDFRKLVEINERVGEVYNNSLRANIKDFDRDIKVQFKDRADIIVKRGQLRRSVGVWRPDQERIKTLAGPRTNNIGGRRKRGVRKTAMAGLLILWKAATALAAKSARAIRVYLSAASAQLLAVQMRCCLDCFVQNLNAG